MPLPFMGELMTCALCGKQQRSDLHVESQWRCIVLDTESYYVCPKHFPDDSAGKRPGKQAYAKAYEKVLKRLIEKHRQIGRN